MRPRPDLPGAVEALAKFARHGVTVAAGPMVLNRLFHERPPDLAIRVYPGLDFLRQNPNGETYLKRMGNLVDFSLGDVWGADGDPVRRLRGARTRARGTAGPAC